MRHLEKFVTYLNESNEDITDLSKEDLDDLLLPITDLGIEYSFSEPRTITEGEFSGYKSINIIFRNSFKLGPSGGYTEQIIDDKFWDFLDELIALKNRLESSRVSINPNMKHHIVSKRRNVSKSDFSNNIVQRLHKDDLKIVVNCNGSWDTASYTDRKWNGLFRGIDFSKFNVEKEITTDRYDNKSAIVTIELKPEFRD